MRKYRATVVIFKDDRVLLVRDRGKRDYSFPGGAFEKNETTIQAGIREVCVEELEGIRVISAERLRHCDLDGQRAYHKVCRLTIEGEPRIKQHRELAELRWWDMKDKSVKPQGHVTYILKKLNKI